MFDREKAIHTVLFISKQLPSPTFHGVFKILYFAEQKHLARYGASIVADVFIAMKNGPVPSKIYDILKALRNELAFHVDTQFEKKLIEVRDNHFILPVGEVKLDVLAESEVECLHESLEENKSLKFSALTEKSHDQAWKNADPNDEISPIELARMGGAGEGMLTYIGEVLENQRLTFNASVG